MPSGTATPVEAAPSGPVVPQFGTFQAIKSPYYRDQVIDPISGAHYDADTGQPLDTEVIPLDLEETNDLRQAAIYTCVLLVLTAISAALAAAVPAWYLSLLAVSNYAAGMIMPLLRAVGFGEDDSGDVALAIGLFLILGPFVGGMFYGVWSLTRQDTNPAIVGIFATYLVLRISLDLATGRVLSHLLPFHDLTPVGLASQWMIFATLAGWYSASIFHKFDE